MAETLVEYEFRWQEAWQENIKTTKQRLSASLIARHPKTGKLFVNFDPHISLLIREAKILDRLEMDIPEDARMLILREKKLKEYFDELKFILEVSNPVTPSSCRIRTLLPRDP